jgi:ribosome-binding protein aMBF1 (putative translation factor)
MPTKNNDLFDVDKLMDEKYGKEGSPQREAFRNNAYAYYVGQIIRDARKEEKITQGELASKVGSNKSYISKIEHGLIEPTIGTFYRIIDALGLKVEITKPIG